MVVLTHRASPGDCNWSVEELNTLCESCRAVIADIVRRAAEEYDLRDPVSMPFFPSPSSNPLRPRARV